MLKSYLWKVLLGGAIFGLLALGISLLAPKKYEGFVQILIDQKALAPTVPMSSAERSSLDLVEFGRPRGIITQVQQLTSFDTLAKAAEVALGQVNASSSERDEFSPTNMRTNVFVDAEVGSDLITLRVHMSKPEFAQAFAGAVYEENEKKNRTSATEMASRARAGLKVTMDKLKADLTILDNQIKASREKSGVSVFEAQSSVDYSALSRLKEVRDQAHIDAAAAQTRLDVLEQQLKLTKPEIVASETTQYNSNILDLERNISIAKADRDGLLARYLPENEFVKAAEARLKSLQTELKNTREKLQASTTKTPNPNYQSLVGAVADARAGAQAMREKAAQADAEVARAEPVMAKYPEIQRELSDLARQQASLERMYIAYSDQYRALEVNEFGRVSPTSLITPAVAIKDPVSPKPMQNLVIGFVVGLILTALLSVRKEATDMPIRSMAQLNALSFVPAYRTIPTLRAPFRGLNRAPHESFEKLVLNCLRSEERPYRVSFFGVTKDSGASTTALNYALALSRRGVKSTIVMVDPKSSLKRNLKTGLPAPGASADIADNVKVFNATEMPLLDVADGHVKLASAISQHESEVTIFDLDAALASADYAILAQVVNEAIVSVRSDRVRSVDFAAAQQALRDAGCPQITVVYTFASSGSAGVDFVDRQEAASALTS